MTSRFQISYFWALSRGVGQGHQVQQNTSGINLKYCYHFTYNNWHLFPLHVCFHLIYYMTTFQKLFFCTWWPWSTPSEEPQNMKSETYSSRPFIWYTTRLSLSKLWFFAFDDLASPPCKGPKIWNPLPGMPCIVGRHYDDVIHPVTWLWRRYEWCYGRCHWRITLVFPLLFCKAHLFHINCFKHFV